MSQTEKETLMALARKYIWWKTAEEAVEFPSRVIAQVMNIGDYDDVQYMANIIGDDTLRDVLTHAEIGQFSERSWNYWHYRLGTATLDNVPPLPTRALDRGLMTIPETSPTCYLSGVASLNLALSNTTGDWHFTTTFAATNQRLPVCFLVGEGREVNTLPLFGEAGIIECSSVLIKQGLSYHGEHVYAATHARAIGDMVVAAVMNGDSPEHVVLDDWMPSSSDKQEVFALLAQAWPRFTLEQRAVISIWLKKNSD